ncbi:MAG TPA: hypothetical protein ENK85_12450, partial [Saprospiraceae bacterium]|nr:hypothetical protein [Saprospiraceae bacterium]
MKNLYEGRIKNLHQQLADENKKNSLFTWLRSLSFLLFAWSLYAWFQLDVGRFFWVIPVILIFLFLKLVGISGGIKQRIKLLQQLVTINQTEINYLNRQFEGLDSGESYQDSQHFFAYDLDVFGLN